MLRLTVLIQFSIIPASYLCKVGNCRFLVCVAMCQGQILQDFMWGGVKHNSGSLKQRVLGCSTPEAIKSFFKIATQCSYSYVHK